MSVERPSRVVDVNEFLVEVIDALEARTAFDDANDAVAWLGDVGAAVRGEDVAAKRRLACRLIALGLPEHVDDTDELVELVVRAGGVAIAEMNAIVARLDSALVPFGEDVVTLDDLAAAGRTMHDALSDGDERFIEVAAFHLAGAVLADPRPYHVPEEDVTAAVGAVEEGLAYSQGLYLPAGTPAEHLHGIVLCARGIEMPNEMSLAPESDTNPHYQWGRIAGHAAELVRWEPFTSLDPPLSAESQLERAVSEAGFLLAASPLLQAPILFEHARAAANVNSYAHNLTSCWLDRALGQFDEDEPDGVIRTVEDLRTQRGLLAQALIGIYCSAG
jgi:hypothetical protein